MGALAVFGIENDGLNLAASLLILFLVVIWLALVYWTFADAHRRVADPLLVGCASAASLFPFVGTVVYLIVRPPEYLEDVHERELEIAAAEARLAAVAHETCPYCEFEGERAFLRCPRRRERRREPPPPLADAEQQGRRPRPSPSDGGEAAEGPSARRARP